MKMFLFQLVIGWIEEVEDNFGNIDVFDDPNVFDIAGTDANLGNSLNYYEGVGDTEAEAKVKVYEKLFSDNWTAADTRSVSRTLQDNDVPGVDAPAERKGVV